MLGFAVTARILSRGGTEADSGSGSPLAAAGRELTVGAAWREGDQERDDSHSPGERQWQLSVLTKFPRGPERLGCVFKLVGREPGFQPTSVRLQPIFLLARGPELGLVYALHTRSVPGSGGKTLNETDTPCSSGRGAAAQGQLCRHPLKTAV